MLWRVIKHARFINDLRQVFGMPWRKAIMPSGLNVQQFIQRVAVRQPGRSLLVRAEKVAGGIEGQGDGKTDTGADDLAMGEVGGYFQNRAPFAPQVIT